jgi:hypothetical protein
MPDTFRLCSRRGFTPGPRQAPARKWAVDDRLNTFIGTEWEYLQFFFSVEQVVVVLHRDEACPAQDFLATAI